MIILYKFIPWINIIILLIYFILYLIIIKYIYILLDNELSNNWIIWYNNKIMIPIKNIELFYI